MNENNENNDVLNDLNAIANSNLADLKDDGTLNGSAMTSAEVENPVSSGEPQQTSVEVASPQVDNEAPVESIVTPVTATTDVPSEVSTSPQEVKPKKKGSKLILGIVVVLVLVIGALAAYQFLFVRNSKRVITSSVANVFDYASKNIQELDELSLHYDFKKDVFHTKGTIQVDTDYEMFKSLSNVLFNYAASIDMAKNKMYLSLGASENAKDIVTLAAYFEKERLTFNSNILNNPYYVDLEDAFDLSSVLETLDELPDVKLADFDVLLQKVKKAIVENMSESKMKSQTETISIQGKSTKVLAHEYKLDEEELNKLVSASIHALEDDESLEILANLTSSSKNEMKTSLDKLLENMKQSNTNDYMTFKVYADSLFGTFKGFDVSFVSSSKVVLDLQYVTDGAHGNFVVTLSDKTYEGTVDYNASSQTYTIVTTIEGTHLEMVYRSNALLSKSVVVKASKDGETIEVSLDVDGSKNGNEITSKFNVGVNYQKGEEHLKVSVHVDETSGVGGSVEEAPKNALSVDKMTADDLVDLLENLENSLKNSSLKDLGDYIESIYDSYLNSYDYDYDYDFSF